MATTIMGVPQSHAFRLGLYERCCVLEEGGPTQAMLSVAEIASEDGLEASFVTWRPGERGELGKAMDNLALAGYGGVVGVIPAVTSTTEYELLAMLIDIANEASDATLILALGLNAIPLARHTVVECLTACGYVPLCRQLANETSMMQRRISGPTLAMLKIALAGASADVEEQEAATLVREFEHSPQSARRVGF